MLDFVLILAAMAMRTMLMAAMLGAGVACIRLEVPPVAKAGSVVPGTISLVVRRGPGGVVVAALAKDGPAARAGLRVGDLVLRYNGVSVADTGQLYRLMVDSPPGSTAVVEVLRDGAPHTFEVPVRQLDTAPRA